MFGPEAERASLVVPAVPLDELYAEPAREWLEARGSEVRTKATACVRVSGDRVVGVDVRGEMIDAPVVIATAPWFALAQLFAPPPPSMGDLAGARRRHRQFADRHGEPVVRPSGARRSADRTAGTRVSVGVRQGPDLRPRSVAPVDGGQRRRRHRRPGRTPSSSRSPFATWPRRCRGRPAHADRTRSRCASVTPRSRWRLDSRVVRRAKRRCRIAPGGRLDRHRPAGHYRERRDLGPLGRARGTNAGPLTGAARSDTSCSAARRPAWRTRRTPAPTARRS